MHGLNFYTNIALHEVMPGLMALLWLLFTPKSGLRWTEPLRWLIYPALYMIWILARGAVIHRYPYFFADVNKQGYPRTLLTGVWFLATFYVLGLAAVAAGRLRFSARPASVGDAAGVALRGTTKDTRDTKAQLRA
jgi:hypothetical protein